MKKNIISILLSTVVILCLVTLSFLIAGYYRNQNQSLVNNLPVFDFKSQEIFSTTTTLSEQQTQENRPILSDTSNKIKVTFIAGIFSSDFSVLKGGSAYDVMLALSASSLPVPSEQTGIKPFLFKAKEYPGIGYFIEEINGIKNEGGKYWTLYVNGKYSTVGASDYKLLDGDKIEWRYE